MDIDAIVVTSTWFSDEDIAAFRDALIAGGPSLPASLFFMTGAHHSVAATMEETARHRLVRNILSLRELRLMILDILGPAEQVNHAARPSSASPNGNGQHLYKRAVDDFSEAIKREPGAALSYRNRGLAYHDSGQLKEAIQDFTVAIELTPTRPMVH